MADHYDDPDPLAIFTAPPPGETPREKAARKEREAEARRLSDRIDRQLHAEKLALQQRGGIVKIVLLGQCQIGKSALIDHLRMRFARDEWERERASLRTAVQLNLVHSVNVILDVLLQALANDDETSRLPFTDEHHLLQLRLRPLRGVEDDLKRLLVVKAEDIQDHQTPLTGTKSSPSPAKKDDVSSQHITNVIADHKTDITALWADHAIREMLERYGVHLDDPASFFLEHAERIAVCDYEPTGDDMIRARPRTVDVQEYELDVRELEDGKSELWKIYDIGGSRTQRNAWLPYFDQVDAVIFLASMAGFDERLQEDPGVCQLQDAFMLWKSICSSRLLSQATLIIVLTEVDVLAQKIMAGVQVKHHVPSYEDRPNETESVLQYFRQKFKDTVKHSSREPRTCHIYSTADTDARIAAQVLLSVREGILRAHLDRASLLS